jgi:hypothetical protein
MADLNELHEKITAEIAEQRNRELDDFVAAKRSRNEAAAKKASQANREFEAMGLDLEKFNAFHRSLAKDNAKSLERIKEKYAAEEDESDPRISRVDPAIFRAVGLDAAIRPDGVADLPPSFAAVFGTKDEDDQLSGGTGTDVFNYTCFDAWDWASGAGNGWFGSGAGSYQVWAEWGYWFWPPASRYYGIIPHTVFRGFYIVRSDDGWFTSKYARALVSIWTDVWQYNWKGWSTVNALDVAGDNIDVNQRFDTDRHTYYPALLGEGDWAYIRNVVGLYVYARGDGSYSELNFATGAANYLCAPHVHVY